MRPPGTTSGGRGLGMADLDIAVARLLRIGTLVAVLLMTLGVLAMAIGGRSPLERPFPELDFARIPSDIAALRPEGFLWLGLVAVILTPISRVTASLTGYVRQGDRSMVLISLAILGVIALSVVISVAAE